MNNARLLAIWLARVVANALAGGLAFAFVGAFCGGATGGVLLSLSSGTFSFGVLVIGAIWGAFLGFMCGIAGIFIHLVAAILAQPGEFWDPYLDLTARVAFGQMWGTIAAVTAFIAFEVVHSQLNNVGFSQNMQNDAAILSVGAPVIMIIGAIASAILKRD